MVNGGAEHARQPVNAYRRFIPAFIGDALHVVQRFATAQHRARVAKGNPDGSTPVYPAVPLPVPMAGNDSGMFQFPPEGTLVEVGFTGGRPDKPFVRQTMPEGTSLPDVKPGEQLQQQRAEVSQRVTQAGDWERQTDQVIRETSMSREVKADTEKRELISRETTESNGQDHGDRNGVTDGRSHSACHYRQLQRGRAAEPADYSGR